jgi:DNA-binding beta-propeller fold protein YncE
MKQLFCGLMALGMFLGTIVPARSDFLYWTDSAFFSNGIGDIQRADLDGSGPETLFTGLRAPTDMKLDLAGGQMYWADGGSGDIQRANLDGSGMITLVSRLINPTGVGLDLAGGKLYWSDAGSGKVGSVNLDGSGLTTLVSGLGSNSAHAMGLDLANGKMYWCNANTGFIQRANLDGSGLERVVSGQVSPHGLALDLEHGKVYWSDFGGDIRRANLDGSGREILVTHLSNPANIALDVPHGQMYWADFASTGDIRRANLDGSGMEILVTGLDSPVGVAIAISPPAAQPILLTGYSADVISDKDPAARFAQPFHAGTFTWFEAGAVDDGGTPHQDGLPAGLPFVGATGSGATYQIQPANGANVLQLSAGNTGTLTLTTPAVYSTLYILASSGGGTPSSLGSGTIHFADGSSQDFSYKTFDWCNGQGGLHPEAALSGPNGRADVGPSGTGFLYNQDCDFQAYETVLAIDPLHAEVAITSIDFTGAPDAYFSNVFGVSGQ